MYFISCCHNKLSWKGRHSAFLLGVQPGAGDWGEGWENGAGKSCPLQSSMWTLLLSFLHVYVHVCAPIDACLHACAGICRCIFMGVGTCESLWRLEADLRCLSQLLSTSFYWGKVLLACSASLASFLTLGILCLCFQALRLQVGRHAHVAFFVDCGGLNVSLHAGVVSHLLSPCT